MVIIMINILLIMVVLTIPPYKNHEHINQPMAFFMIKIPGKKPDDVHDSGKKTRETAVTIESSLKSP